MSRAYSTPMIRFAFWAVFSASIIDVIRWSALMPWLSLEIGGYLPPFWLEDAIFFIAGFLMFGFVFFVKCKKIRPAHILALVAVLVFHSMAIDHIRISRDYNRCVESRISDHGDLLSPCVNPSETIKGAFFSTFMFY